MRRLDKFKLTLSERIKLYDGVMGVVKNGQ